MALEQLFDLLDDTLSIDCLSLEFLHDLEERLVHVLLVLETHFDISQVVESVLRGKAVVVAEAWVGRHLNEGPRRCTCNTCKGLLSGGRDNA